MMTTQACPNCGLQHDIRVYVSGQKVPCRCGIRFEVRRGDVAGGSRAPGLSGISQASRVDAAAGLRTTVVPGGSAVTAERPSGVLASVMSSSEAGGNVLPGVAMANTVVPEEEAGPRNGVAVLPGVARANTVVPVEEGAPPNGVAVLPGVAAPAVGAGGMAPPSAAVVADGVGATVVRSSVATSSGSDHSNVDVHAASTLVAGAKVDLPGFELLEVLGRGGMGEVWLARQQSLGRTVAVKLLPPRLAKDPEFVTRFEKEATALAALNHPHIIQIIDRGVAGEHYFFVMEYVEGRSLREAMMSRALTPQQGLKLMLSVARAIECAHDKGIIHRDLKPENILLDGRGHVKVADFGLAGIRQPDSRLQLTATAVAMGTLNYMAPEQRRDAKSVDGRADLFSLGVILYEMLTGELPLGRFKLPSAKVPGLDPRVDAVVERLLETEPAARYAHAGELCAALEAMVASTSAPNLAQGELDGRPVPAGAKAASQVSRRLRLGWRRVRGGLSVVGGLAVLGLGVRLLTGAGQDTGSEPEPTGPWPPNTYGEVFASVNLVTPAKPGDKPRFEVNFEPGQEEINVHSGQWTLRDGQLRAVQGGKQTDGQRLVPRAYVAHRYFSTNDFNAEVVMNVAPLGKEYAREADAQHYGELAFRIKDLQVSAFAIPEAGMRLAWRYYTENGQEVVGNSALDTDNLVGDEMPLPAHGPYLVRLQLRKVKGGVMAEAFLNNERFAHKLLPGLEDRVGKVALGCRNLVCTFDDLKVRGTLEARPARRVAGGAE